MINHWRKYQRVILIAVVVVSALLIVAHGVLKKKHLSMIHKISEKCSTNINDLSNSTLTPCSLISIEREMIESVYFPTGGTWRNIDQGYPCASYSPRSCSLPAAVISSSFTKAYMELTKPRHILLMGDSMGHGYYNSLVMLFEIAGYRCKIIKQETDSYIPKKQYYVQGTNIDSEAIVTAQRTCHSCLSTLQTCYDVRTNYQINLEYISMIVLSNATILPNETYCQIKSTDPVCSVATQQDFLFRIYLRDRFPDLLLVFTTFAHDRERNSTAEVKTGIRYLFNILRETSKNKGTILVFPGSKMNLAKSLSNEVNFTFTEEGLDSNGMISALNHVLYEAMMEEKMVHNTTNMYGFLDLFSMSDHDDLTREWSIDHVHFKRPWYQMVMAYVMGVLAAE